MSKISQKSRFITSIMLGTIMVGFPIALAVVQSSTEYRQRASEIEPMPSTMATTPQNVPFLTNSISSQTLSSGMGGINYSATVVGYSQASSAPLTMTTKVYDGTVGLPASLSLEQCITKNDSVKRTVISCRITGTPKTGEKGTYTVPITVTDGAAHTSITKQYTLAIGDPVVIKAYIESITELNSLPGSNVTISGADFGVTRGGVNFYRVGVASSFGGVITSWSENHITVTLPTTLTPSQDYMVEVLTADGKRSTQKLYHVGP